MFTQLFQKIGRYKKQLAFVGLFCVAGFGFTDKNQYFFEDYFEISKNIDIFGKLYREVNANYVDEVEPNKFIRTGIDAMLKNLDPYTSFISASEIEDYRFMSTGQYGGVGASISQRTKDKKVVISEPYENSPAWKSGLRAGDEIIQIDNEAVTEKMSNSDVRNLLRGQPKTKVKIVVKRYNQAEPMTFMVERDEIKVKNVPFFGMIDDKTGYIALTGFTKDASLEVKHALEKLKSDNKNIAGIVLDLRDNPGGLLFEAIDISNLFVDKGEKIVETRGRMENSARTYTAKNLPVDSNIGIVVLINGRSASAAEIVSGVMQDLDRGVIVGRKSFGKGLVQNTRPLSYNTQLKITTAKYYTPSGRCIQAIDYSNRDNDGKAIKIADSLRKEFKTKGGRPVFDGAGIEPDIKVEDPDFHPVTRELLESNLLFDFVTKFFYENPSIGTAKEFKVTDKIYFDFVNFVQSKSFKFSTDTEKELRGVEESMKKEGYYDNVKPHLEAIFRELENNKQNDITKYKAEILPILQRSIVMRYYHQNGAIENSFQYDKDILEAKKILANEAEMKKVLKKN